MFSAAAAREYSPDIAALLDRQKHGEKHSLKF